MNTTATTDPREALAEAERKAAAQQPENFKERETDEKIVEIGPDLTDAPIEGIDPPEGGGQGGGGSDGAE